MVSWKVNAMGCVSIIFVPRDPGSPSENASGT